LYDGSAPSPAPIINPAPSSGTLYALPMLRYPS
jgi:hypothetical protein